MTVRRIHWLCTRYTGTRTARTSTHPAGSITDPAYRHRLYLSTVMEGTGLHEHHRVPIELQCPSTAARPRSDPPQIQETIYSDKSSREPQTEAEAPCCRNAPRPGEFGAEKRKNSGINNKKI